MGNGFWFGFWDFFLASEWGRQAAGSTSQSRCLDGWVTHCTGINFCLSACCLPHSFHSCFLLSLITCFCKLFFLHVLGVTRLFGLWSWDFKFCFISNFLMGLLEFPLLSLTLLNNIEGFSIGQTSNLKWSWWWNAALKNNCSSEALELQCLQPHAAPSQ